MRITRLDALRGIAAGTVLLQHVMEQVIGKADLPSWLDAALSLTFADGINFGRFGVALFFLISGFVIPFSFRGDRPLLGFATSRFFRLYPAYWASLILALVVLWLTGRPMPGVGTALVNVSMFQTFVGVADVVDAYWTLALELLFYVACAALFRLRLLSSGAASGGAVAMCLGASIGLAGLSLALDRHLPANIPLNLGLMFTGTLVRLAWLNGDALARRILPAALAGLLIAIPFVQWAAYLDSVERYVQPVPFTTAYLLAIGGFLVTLRGNWEPGRLWVWMGAISYSVYLVHGPWLKAMVTLFHPLTSQTALPFIACVFIATIANAALFYYLIEKPCVRLGHRLMARLSTDRTVRTPATT